MYSDVRKPAGEIITELINLLNETSIRSLIDGPIDKVVINFHYRKTCPVAHKQFLRLIESLVHTIYEEGLRDSWRPLDPLAEALSLLERHYQGTYARGYIAARLDANDSDHGGIETVLQRLAESIKSSERTKYTQSVFVRCLNPTDWKTRCKIANIFLEHCRPYLPPQMLQCVPEQMVDDIPLLMNIYLNSENIVQHISHSHQK